MHSGGATTPRRRARSYGKKAIDPEALRRKADRADAHVSNLKLIKNFPALMDPLMDPRRTGNLPGVHVIKKKSKATGSTPRKTKTSKRGPQASLPRSGPSFDPVSQDSSSALNEYRRRLAEANGTVRGNYSSANRRKDPLVHKEPFRPTGVYSAKDAIRRRASSQNVFESCDYDAEAEAEKQRKYRSKAMMKGGPFYTAASGAKEKIKIDYYLNSVDEQTKQAEKRVTAEKSKRTVDEFNHRVREAQSTSKHAVSFDKNGEVIVRRKSDDDLSSSANDVHTLHDDNLLY